MNKYKSIVLRFVKAFISGFFAGAVLITATNIHLWGDLANALNSIGLSGIIGGVNAVLMAGEKWANWKDVSTE